MHVYPPDEDTFLLEDAIRLDLTAIRSTPKIIVEVGTGSGYISNVLRAIFPNSYVISTDINPYAVSSAHLLMRQLKNGDVLRASMVDGISQIDVAIFNPPYLPSTKEELSGNWIDRSWAGGESGAEVVKIFLKRTSHVPIRYLLLCSLNHPNDIISSLSLHYACTLIISRKVLSENLLVIKIRKR
ncbi:release factor glutamine methyltransferase [Nematocida sp. LUAm3]|nr:release factor glutamine methyltransferase [Nematocida sp. LUAm3]KAI5173526.1 release factor glutamine methyltransferase [Nematocida sp. LUAm2]KAI5176747.1 release factor glutamine methyltransferase [Nematocida sp. LUAm1]